MNSLLFPIHVSFAGVWLGCVVTEALFERALLGQGRQQELILAELHKRVDLIVEIPAFVVVLVTGVLIDSTLAASGLLKLKIGFGLLAVIVNLYCVWLVFRRSSVAKRGEWAEFSRLDYKQHRYGAVVFISIVMALVLGIFLHWTA
jgi:hypothetical protein